MRECVENADRPHTEVEIEAAMRAVGRDDLLPEPHHELELPQS